MKHLLAAELLKIRKRWMPYILALITLLIVGLLFWGSGADKDRINVIMPRAWLSSLSFASLISFILWPILAGSWAGNEYGWGTVRLILSRRPDRIQWVLGALIILTLVVGLVLVAAIVVGSIAAILIAVLTSHHIFETGGLQSGYPLIVLKAFLGNWFVLTFYVVLAYAAGTVFRSGAVGIALGIGLTFVQVIGAGIFHGLGGAWNEVALHFPYVYSNALVDRLTTAGTTGHVASDLPGAGASVLGLTLYLAILVGVTLYVVSVRDVSA